MPLVDHLRELRYRLGVSLLAVAVCMVVAFFFWQPVYDFLREPYCRTQAGRDSGCQLVALSVLEQFAVRLRVSTIVGVLAASPVWLYQLAAFITPALHKKERRYALGFVVASLILFGLGGVFSYYTVDRGLEFLLGAGGEGVQSFTSIRSYLSFVTLTLVAFGIAFEFPAILIFLHLVGAFPAAKMRAWRRGMIVAIAVATAVITPSQDPYTFLVMAVPLYVFYEAVILFARARERRLRRRRAADPLASVPDDEASYVDEEPSRL